MSVEDLRRTVPLEMPRAFTEAAIDASLGPLLGDRLYWAIRPRLGLRAMRAWQRLGGSAAHGTGAVRGLAASVRRAMGRVGGVRALEQAQALFDDSDGVLRLWTTENHAVALGRPAPAGSLTISWSSGGGVPRSGALEALARSGGLSGSLFDPLLARAEQEDAAVTRLLDEERPRVVVVASLEHSLQRLLVWHARARGIPSALVPHAPTPVNRQHADLPVDLVLAQGEKDVTYYCGLGADRASFVVTGGASMPSPSRGPSADSDSDRTVVFAATSRLRHEDLEPVLLQVADRVRALGLPLIVSPHPRERDPVVRLCERLALPVHRGRTSELIERGAWALVAELSSGALLEAAIAGAPSGVMTGFASYAFMPDLGIDRLDGPGQLELLLSDTTERDGRLQDRARGWVAATGAEAVARIDRALGRPLEVGVPALDSWGIFA